MSTPSTTPRRITVETGLQTLTIEWADGHRTVFPLDGLRRACPCASCMGGHGNMGRLPEPEVFRLPALMRWVDVRVEPVGTYAIRIRWDDGHASGIYTWKRLRATCPCDACTGGA
jgi:DUF971 family protein